MSLLLYSIESSRSMTDEMMENTETPSPFESLPDDPVLHILSYLPGADLLRLSSVNQNFKRIITESHKTMKKIPLVLNFDNDDSDNRDLDDAIKLTRARRFTSLKLQSVYRIDPEALDKFYALLEVLSESVEDLEVLGKIFRELLSIAITLLLPKLKKCKLYIAWYDTEAGEYIEEINQDGNINNHPLESLEIVSTNSDILELFSGCNQLKVLSYFHPDSNVEHINGINDFLATQSHLERLVYYGTGIAWHRLVCYHLKELKTECSPNFVDRFAAAQFLKKLPHLVSLNMGITNHPRHLLRTICKVPQLKKLTIECKTDANDNEGDSLLEELVNHTVKELYIDDYTGVTAKLLLKIFLGVDSIFLAVKSNDNLALVQTAATSSGELDLSDVPPTTIIKIKPNDDYCCEHFAVKFSPSELPTNVEEFQSAVLKFASEFSRWITNIVIGNETIRSRGGDFNLSNSFCEGLVNILPNLVTLEVFNIANRGKFIAFLDENKSRLSLENIKLHETFGADEPNPKKMKIQID